MNWRRSMHRFASAFDIRFVFNQWTLGEEFCTGVLGIPREKLNDPTFNLLSHLGYSKADIDAANDHVCGTMTLEGAPHLKEEHLTSFDCANPCGKKGKRFLSVDSHILHDGCGAIVHLWRDLQDDQHAE